jgi:hypothetical protein
VPGLTLDDESKLRDAFHKSNSSHESMEKISKLALFAAYWPACWRIARQTSATGVLVFTGAYYFGFYKQIVQPFGV